MCIARCPWSIKNNEANSLLLSYGDPCLVYDEARLVRSGKECSNTGAVIDDNRFFEDFKRLACSSVWTSRQACLDDCQRIGAFADGFQMQSRSLSRISFWKQAVFYSGVDCRLSDHVRPTEYGKHIQGCIGHIGAMVLAVWIIVPGLAWPAHLFVWSSRRILHLVAVCKRSFSDHQTVGDGLYLQNQVE